MRDLHTLFSRERRHLFLLICQEQVCPEILCGTKQARPAAQIEPKPPFHNRSNRTGVLNERDEHLSRDIRNVIRFREHFWSDLRLPLPARAGSGPSHRAEVGLRALFAAQSKGRKEEHVIIAAAAITSAVIPGQ